MKDLNIIVGTFGEIYDATWKTKKRVNYYYKYYVDTNSQYFFVSHLLQKLTNKPFGCGPSAVPFSLHRPVYEQKPFCAISIWLESSRSIKLHPFIIRGSECEAFALHKLNQHISNSSWTLPNTHTASTKYSFTDE